MIVCGVIGFVAVLFVGLIVVWQLGSHKAEDTAGEPIAVSGPSPESSLSPTADPTASTPPDAVPNAVPNARDNPLYEAGQLPEVNCPYPGVRRGASAMRGFLTEMTDCLDDAWQETMRSTNLPWEPVTTMYFTSPGRGPCGDYPATPNTPAYYCRSNQTIYIGAQHIVRAMERDPSVYHYVYLTVLAHEYGHHVQGLSGISEGGWRLEALADSEGERLEITRRHELQAQCLSGIFVGSIKGSYGLSPAEAQQVIRFVYTVGDNPGDGDRRDHGNERNNGRWYERGFRQQDPTACQTYSADDEDVA